MQMGEAYTFLDNLTKVSGKHTLKAGLVYRLEHVAWAAVSHSIGFQRNHERQSDDDSGRRWGARRVLDGAVPSGTSSTGNQGPWYSRYRTGRASSRTIFELVRISL